MSERLLGLLIGDQRIDASGFLVSLGGRVLSEGVLFDLDVNGRRVSLHVILVPSVIDYFESGGDLPKFAIFAYDAGDRQSFVNLSSHFAELEGALSLHDPSDLPLLLLATRAGDAVPAAEARRFAADHLDMLTSGGIQGITARMMAPPFFSGRITPPFSAGVRYLIRSCARVDLACEIAGASRDAGAALTVGDARGGASQQFFVGQTIVSANSGMLLTAREQGRVVQMPDVAGPAQCWEWHREDETIRSADGKTALQIHGTPDSAVEVWAMPISGENRQRWALEAVQWLCKAQS